MKPLRDLFAFTRALTALAVFAGAALAVTAATAPPASEPAATTSTPTTDAVATTTAPTATVSTDADADAAALTDLLARAAAAEARFDSRAALALYEEAHRARPADAFILQKIARQYSDSIVDVAETDVAEKKRLALLALQYAERAVQIEPHDPVNVLSLAISHGKLALTSSTREKIRLSRLVREEAERALALKSDYDFAHHVLGKWNHEVASLGAGTRFLVKLAYGGLPDASIAKAIHHFETACKIDPTAVAHRVELGFAYLGAGDRTKARSAFEQGLALPTADKHDEPAKARARAALARLE